MSDNNKDLPFPETDGIPNWAEVLKSGDPGSRRVYVISPNKQEVFRWVQQAVFKTLTDQELFEPDSPIGFAPTEDLELQFLDIIEKEETAEAKAGYPEAKVEANKQAREASGADFTRWRPWSVHYDRWQAKRLDKDIYLESPNDDFLLLVAPIQEIGEQTGFPRSLIHRGSKTRASEGANMNSTYETYVNNLVALGYDRDTVDREIKNHAIEQHFYLALGGRGYERVNAILSEHGKPHPRGVKNEAEFNRFFNNRIELLAFVYSQLTTEEQERVKQTTRSSLNPRFTQQIKERDQVAELVTGVLIFEADMKYNPDTGQMEIDLSPTKEMSLSVELNPIITPETTHTNLIKLREKTLTQLKTAGITS